MHHKYSSSEVWLLVCLKGGVLMGVASTTLVPDVMAHRRGTGEQSVLSVFILLLALGKS